MKVDVTIPELAESVSEAIIGDWLKKPGEFVEEGEQLVEVETDKVILEITAPQTGELTSIAKHKNEHVQSNEVIAVIDTSKKGSKSTSKNGSASFSPEQTKSEQAKAVGTTNTISQIRPNATVASNEEAAPPQSSKSSPSVRKLAAENKIDIKSIRGTGKEGRITKSDIEQIIDNAEPSAASELDSATEIMRAPQIEPIGLREDKRVPMTTLRKSISKRLVQSQHESAMLTTFNEVNMQSIMNLRKRYKESFEQSHGVKLGFMSFFVKAVVEALKEFPVINASIEDTDIIYHDYFDIGVAVSTQRGLMVPIVRDADTLSFSGIEKTINDLAVRAQENKVTIEELSGGTFTISNGGIFGSMMSTPIINPPQSAILGMHSIQARPIAQGGEVIIAPMMYLALSYDHRIIDGKEAVQFLNHIKNIIEDPNRLLLQV
jgi:2-oxoglutarate dehydrogenase E2 component (dihydrolipoamide succinyltransferase)